MRYWLRERLDAIAGSPSRALLAFSLSLLSGIAVAAVFEQSDILLISLAVSVFVYLILPFNPDRKTRIIWCLVLACLPLGVWRYDVAYGSSAYAKPPVESVSENFEGRVISFPQVRVTSVMMDMDDISDSDGAPVDGKARLYVRTPYEYRYGDVIRWQCKPRPVSGEEGWDDRLLLDGVRWTCNVYSDPEIIKRGRGHPVRTTLLNLKASVRDAAWRVFPEPGASLLLGLLVGMKEGLPSEVTDSFRDTGTSHILAVSGYNVTQLIEVGVLVFALATVRRRRSSGMMVTAVIVFACIVGGDASVIRAAVMGTVSVLAVWLGRKYDSVRSLSVAAALMLVANPLSLRHDVGFQLSFAAVWGLYSLAPALYRSVPAKCRGVLARTATETAAATLATAPIVLGAFGRLPYVGLLANILILPLIPWVMLLGVIALIVGAFLPFVAAVPALFADIIMRAILWTAGFLARYLPCAFEAQTGPIVTAMLFAWLLLLAYALKRLPRV